MQVGFGESGFLHSRERTFASLTGDPIELVAPIHPRMTTFVEPRDYEEYLAASKRPPDPSPSYFSRRGDTHSVGEEQPHYESASELV